MPFRCLLRSAAAALLAAGVLGISGQQTDSLDAGFRTPPAAARLRCYWWWLNGNTDRATITHDLEEMKAKGFGGALLVDANGADQNGNRPVPAGPEFGSPAWVALYTHALAEADRLGLEITLNITSGWNLGGPDVTPAQASKLLTWSGTSVHGGAAVSQKLPQPDTKEGFYRDIAVLAYPVPLGQALPILPDGTPGKGNAGRATIMLRERSAAAETGFSMPDSAWMLQDRAGEAAPGPATPLASVQNLSASMAADGTLHWTPPPGEWEILRIGYTASGARVSTASGAWQGLAIDYLSAEAFTSYWNHTVDPLLLAAKPYHSLRFLATDSWELGGTNWTQDFREQFQRRRGYDPVPWLPVLAGRTVESPEASTRFLADLRRTVGDLVVAGHYDVFAAKAAEHGLGVQAESGGPHGAPLDALETFRHSAIPQSEFWSENPHRSTGPERFFTKEAASAANIYGQHVVAQEGETSIGPQWSESLATDLKPSFDMAITEGMNRMVWHEFTSSPAGTGLPGQEYFAGTHLNPKVTWWDAGTPFFTYMNRAQFLMQQGTPVDDVLYFYGDNVPTFVRWKAEDPAHVLPGYDYDVTDEDALLHSISLDGGLLRGPSGVTWRLLALPKTGRFSLAALERIAAYVRGGGAVSGPRPDSPTGLSSDANTKRFRQLVAEAWGPSCAEGTHHPYGRGQIFCGSDGRAALAALQVPPDVESAGVPLSAAVHAQLDYIHRRTESVDVYFLRNGSAVAQTAKVTFRSALPRVELWDLVTGATCRANAVNSGVGRTSVPVSLPAFGSVAVVFRREAAKEPPPCLPSKAHEEPVSLTQPWTVTFQSGRGAPAGEVSFPALTDWTASAEPGIRYFSGTAVYRNTLTAPATPPGSRVDLVLDDVREIAQVRINGHDAGTLWAKPLTLRVDPLLHPGTNTIEIAVTNLWPNRIIGDLQPGTKRTFTHTNITTYRADSPLLPSGLSGTLRWLIQTHPIQEVLAK